MKALFARLWLPDGALAGTHYDDKRKGAKYNVCNIANPALGAQDDAAVLKALGVEAETTVANKLQDVTWPASLRSVARAGSLS